MLHLKSFGQTGGPNGAIDWLEFTSLLEHHSKLSTLSHESFSSYIFFSFFFFGFSRKERIPPGANKMMGRISYNGVTKDVTGLSVRSASKFILQWPPHLSFFHCWTREIPDLMSQIQNHGNDGAPTLWKVSGTRLGCTQVCRGGDSVKVF